MKIVLIHYHLNTGGVTSVIRDQIRAITSIGGDVLVVSGTAPHDNTFSAPVVPIEALAYDQDVKGSPMPAHSADAILSAIHAHWPEGADVIHVHNPTLAKNRRLQEILQLLQDRGQRLLCQIHDFAEDGRPEVYYRTPYLRDCHYACINNRDHRLLMASGLKSDGCHLLPNAVSLSPPPPAGEVGPDADVLYPVRAIRRKNIGEAILLTLFFAPRQRLGITLPPNSPKDQVEYALWRHFVQEYYLPVNFEAGLKSDFSRLMATCGYVLTTSINEGFGFAFLEPWVAGKPLWGRLLPDICTGFSQNGLRLGHLYTGLRIPLNWTAERELSRRWQSAMQAAAEHYGLLLAYGQTAAGWGAVTAGRMIDFGLLDEASQRDVILKLIDKKSDRDHLISNNLFLMKPGPTQIASPDIAHNRSVVEAHYHPGQYARRLEAVYRAVIHHPVAHQIDKQHLARAFLEPARFSLLKWGP